MPLFCAFMRSHGNVQSFFFNRRNMQTADTRRMEKNAKRKSINGLPRPHVYRCLLKSMKLIECQHLRVTMLGPGWCLVGVRSVDVAVVLALKFLAASQNLPSLFRMRARLTDARQKQKCRTAYATKTTERTRGNCSIYTQHYKSLIKTSPFCL